MSIKPSCLMLANSNLLELNGLRNALTGDFVTSALVVATIDNTDGSALAGMAWPVTLNFVDDSDGCYRALLDTGIALVHGQRYRVTIAAQGDGLDYQNEQYVRAQVRRD